MSADDQVPEQGELIPGGFSFLVTQAQLGDVLSLGHSMIAKLRDEGMPRVRTGVYDLRECVGWYVDKWRRARGDGSNEETSTRAALNIAQRERIQLEMEQTRGELLQREVVRATIAQLGVVVASRLSGLSSRCAPDLADLRDVAEVRAYLRAECRSVLEQMAASVRELSADLQTTFEQSVVEPAPKPPRASRKKRAA